MSDMPNPDIPPADMPKPDVPTPAKPKKAADALKKKYGPFPLGVWLLIGGTAIALGLYLRHKAGGGLEAREADDEESGIDDPSGGDLPPTGENPPDDGDPIVTDPPEITPPGGVGGVMPDSQLHFITQWNAKKASYGWKTGISAATKYRIQQRFVSDYNRAHPGGPSYSIADLQLFAHTPRSELSTTV